MEKETITNSVCGTPEYYAPELISKGGYTKSVDWWTLGCFTFELCFGKCPFKHKDSKVLKKKIMDGDVSFPDFKNVSAKFKHFIISLLTVDPLERLGNNGFEEVRLHPWFAKVKFDKLESKSIEPPFKPKLLTKDDLK
mmetsp:Transcript_3257/g.2798  ORF Transcript_3257/g.2798 Transcript_3257/m.2798 type:complete len:138 (+) Transcript_3257:551-964(+)